MHRGVPPALLLSSGGCGCAGTVFVLPGAPNTVTPGGGGDRDSPGPGPGAGCSGHPGRGPRGGRVLTPAVSRAQREPAALAGGVSSLPGSHQAFPSSIFYSRSPARLFSAEEAPSGSGNACPSHGGTFSRRFAHSVTRRVRARPRCHRQPPGTRRRPHGSLAGVGDAGTHPRGPLSRAGGVSAPRGPLCGAARWVRAGARLLWGLFCRGMERGVGSSIPPVLPAAELACSPGRAGGRTHHRVPRRELSLCLKFVGSAWIPPPGETAGLQ